MQQETSGDYGYDLAHDDVQPARRPPEPPARPEQPAPARRSAPADPAGDLEYDEAHDF
jgi:hypothetical protein